MNSKDFSKVLLVSLCLPVSTFLADRFASAYSDRIHQIGTWNLAIRYSDTAAGLFLVFQMVVVIVVVKVGRSGLSLETLRHLLSPSSIRPALWGVLVGLFISAGAYPLLILFDRHVQFVRLLLDDPVSLQTVLLACLLGAIVPVTTEVVFRGIIFDVIASRTSAGVALVVSALLFAYVWIPFDMGVALLLGLACALLYRRFNSLVPGVICSAVVTVLASLILFLRLLFRITPG